MSGGVLVAIITMAVGIALAVIKFWDQLFRRPRFDAHFAWGSDEYGPVLDIVVRNVGTKQGATQALYFRTGTPDPEIPWHQWDMEPLHAAFSAVLDTDGVTPPIEISLGRIPPAFGVLIKALSEGNAELTIVSARGEEHMPIPALGQGPPPPKLEDLRG